MALWSALLLLGAIGSAADKPAGYEWNGALARNPVLPGYFADPCIRKFGDTYYFYVTPDGWDVGKGPFCIWTSKDFVHWKSHKSNWPTTNEKWAPSVVKVGGKYTMYTQTPCSIWAAVSDTPLGPWKSLAPEGQPIIPDQTPKGSIVLDGECFIDDDSQIYMWYSTWWTPTLAKMKSDMHTIDGDPIQYFESGRNPGYKAPFGTIQGCMEAPYMLKRKGVYYLMYSNNFCQDHTYQVEYSTSPTPWGPFTYGKNNPILSTNDDDTVDGPGHHSILEDGGRIYIVYHRHDNPHHPDGAHRQTAVDELHFLPDGSIEKVTPSHTGIGYLAPSTVRDTNLALGVSVWATSSAGRFFAASHVADENNGTLWKAKEYKYPQSITLDLGKTQGVARVETEFQFAQIGYKYVLETSTNGNKWLLYADRKANREWGPMVDARKAKARYVRLTILGDDTPHRPIKEIGVWNIKVYDGIDKPNRAPKVSIAPQHAIAAGRPTRFLQASVDDDGLPYGPVKVKWSVVSGPDKVVFENADRLATSATFGKAGKYVLKLTADDGKLKGVCTATYEVVPPTAELMNLTFNEPYGNVAKDRTPNGNDGILKVGIKRSVGPAGGAVRLGARDLISLPHLLTRGDWTFAGWVNLHQSRGSSTLLSLGSGLKLVIDEFGSLCLLNRSGQVAASEPMFTKDRIGAWIFVATVYDAKSCRARFYQSGKLWGESAVPVGQPLSAAGAYLGGGFVGELSGIRLWGKALDTSKVKELAKGESLDIRSIKSLKDGARVRILAKMAVYAPINLRTNERSAPFFYIADETGAIRVDDSAFGKEPIFAGSRYSFDASIKTVSGEKVAIPLSEPSLGAEGALQPKLNAFETGSYAKLRGVVGKIESEGFILQTASKPVRVFIAKGMESKKIAEDYEVEAVGVAVSEGLFLSELKLINPTSTDLLVRYTFDGDSAGVAKDSSGNGYSAKIVGPARYDGGVEGQAMALNGIDAYLQMPELGMHQSMTMAAWIKVNSLNRREWAMSIFHRPTWEPGDPHAQVMNDTGAVRLAVNGNTPELIDSRYSFRDHSGEWVHVAIAYDSRTRRASVYINGRKDSETEFSIARPLNLDNLKLGCWGPEPRFLNGSVDDFRLYDRVLSEDEIAKIKAFQP